MIYSLALSMLLASSPTHAASSVKSCRALLQVPGQPTKIATEIEVQEEEGRFSATVTHEADGNKLSTTETVEIAEYHVQENVGAADVDTLNRGETLVAHALAFTKEFSEINVKVDLSDIRRVKVYQVGRATELGSASLVENYDGKGKLLGTFLGGFLVAACE